MIWDECERRYESFTRKPIELRVPYFRQLDVPKVKTCITSLLEGKGWPSYLVEWQREDLEERVRGSCQWDLWKLLVQRSRWGAYRQPAGEV